MNKLGVVSIVFMLFNTACYYDVEENLYPTMDCNTANVTYIKDIKPIIVINCLVCHSREQNQGLVVLEEHTDILNYVNSGALIGSINHKAGWQPMPKSANKLDACKIDKITSWVNAGAPNN